MSSTSEIEAGMRVMRLALEDIARSNDCAYDLGEARPEPCPCAKCTARAALSLMDNWRFEGSDPDRRRGEQGSSPRERAIVEAWREVMGTGLGVADRNLARLLREETTPSVRDWRVATSVVQWLATNVGCTVLQAAGFMIGAKP